MPEVRKSLLGQKEDRMKSELEVLVPGYADGRIGRCPNCGEENTIGRAGERGFLYGYSILLWQHGKTFCHAHAKESWSRFLAEKLLKEFGLHAKANIIDP